MITLYVGAPAFVWSRSLVWIRLAACAGSLQARLVFRRMETDLVGDDDVQGVRGGTGDLF
jgi:hypothetical protein